MPIGNFIFKYDNNNIIFNNCEINRVINNYSSYDYLKRLNPIHNINIKIVIENIDCLNELNKMFNYFNSINNINNKLLIFNEDVLILCENLIIENLEIESIDNFYPQYSRNVKLNIISNKISIFSEPELYHRKMKIDKILLRINEKEKTI